MNGNVYGVHFRKNGKEAVSSQEYLGYWHELIDSNAYLSEQYPHAKQTARTNHRDLQRKDQVIAQEFATQGRSYTTEVHEWYFKLGAMNRLHGAADRLLQAGMVMERHVDEALHCDKISTYEYAREDREDAISQALRSSAGAEQCSDEEKLLSGCLFHEAALLIDHPENTRWMQRALDRYDILISDDVVPETNPNHQLALRYSYDFLFQ